MTTIDLSQRYHPVFLYIRARTLYPRGLHLSGGSVIRGKHYVKPLRNTAMTCSNEIAKIIDVCSCIVMIMLRYTLVLSGASRQPGMTPWGQGILARRSQANLSQLSATVM